MKKPNWIEGQDNYEFQIDGQAHETKIHAAGVQDKAGIERSQLILMDRADSQGLSVLEPDVARQCIEEIANGGNFKPSSVDWFARGRDGTMYAIEVQTEQTRQEHPQATFIRQDDDNADMRAVKKIYPDVLIEKVKDVAAVAATQKQEDSLLKAFGEARAAHLQETVTDPALNRDSQKPKLSL